MNRILDKKHFSEKVVQLVVEAPLIARARKPGHFVIVICNEKGERIPLTIADADEKSGTITLVVQAVGASTTEICAKEPGEYLHDVVGPLGRATEIADYGTVVCCGGGVGVAPLLPILKAMKAAGNRVVSVLAARGACRVTVGGKMRFVCVDGPEFDAHQVDFDEMIMRLRP